MNAPWDPIPESKVSTMLPSKGPEFGIDMSCSLNSLKGGLYKGYIGVYCRAY